MIKFGSVVEGWMMMVRSGQVTQYKGWRVVVVLSPWEYINRNIITWHFKFVCSSNNCFCSFDFTVVANIRCCECWGEEVRCRYAIIFNTGIVTLDHSSSSLLKATSLSIAISFPLDNSVVLLWYRCSSSREI